MQGDTSFLAPIIHPFIDISRTTLHRSAGWCGVTELILSPTRDKMITLEVYNIKSTLVNALRADFAAVQRKFIKNSWTLRAEKGMIWKNPSFLESNEAPMKALMKKIDLFCYKHPRFGIPNLMLYVVIGNVLVWLFSMMDTQHVLLSALTFSPYHIMQGQVWRLLTFIIIPNNTGFLAIIFFYFYYMIGKTLEDQWGSGKFTIYFFTGVILTVLYGFALYFIWKINYPINAEFIYLSMFFSFATLFPDMTVLLFFVIPIKMKWLAIVDAVFFLISIVTTPFPLNLLPVIALLNYLLFCGGWLFDYFKPARRKQRAKTVNFKNEVRRIQYEQKTKPYSRKCEVCGRTDADFPGLEFRYCSRCEGYHCFCIDHINNHRHFTE